MKQCASDTHTRDGKGWKHERTHNSGSRSFASTNASCLREGAAATTSTTGITRDAVAVVLAVRLAVAELNNNNT